MKDEIPHQRVGIKQIADALGLSIGSVDRALHGRPGVNPKTRDRILKTAARLNYTPNLAARNLKLNKHLRIGIFLPKQIASYFDPLRAGIRAAANSANGANFEVVFHTYPRLGFGEAKCLKQNQWQQFDGIILAPGNPANIAEIAREADQIRKPFVFVTTDAPRLPRLSSVAVESAISGGIAAELFGQILPQKASVIAITGDLNIQDHADKLRGFAAGLAVHSPHLALLPAIESQESPEAAHRAARTLLARHPHLGGIYINTANSMPVLRALKESGKLKRIKVITTDLFPELANLVESGSVFASLTQRPYTQGRMAFEILSRYLVEGIIPAQTVRLTPHIVLRSNLALMLESITPPPPDRSRPQESLLYTFR